MTDTAPLLEHILVEPQGPADASVIWLHGLGADGHDFEAIVPELRLPEGHGIRFVFPHAPIRPVTINGGMRMRAWYDVDPDAGPDSATADIEASAASVQALIDAERRQGRRPPDRARRFLAGVITLHLGLRTRVRLAGLMGLSTYLHDHEHVAEACDPANVDTPILMCHGVADAAIPVTRAILARETLLGLGYRVEWHEYGIGHGVSADEIRTLAQWLGTVLPPQEQ